jgi:hypothetical protein
MNPVRLARNALVIVAVAAMVLPMQASATAAQACPTLPVNGIEFCLLATGVIVSRGVHDLVIVPNVAYAEAQEWSMPLPTGGSVSLICLSVVFPAVSACPALAALGFSFVRTQFLVTAPWAGGGATLCDLEVYSATLWAKASGIGVEGLPVVTAGVTCI